MGDAGHSGLTLDAYPYFVMLRDVFPIDPSSLLDLPRCRHATVLAGRQPPPLVAIRLGCFGSADGGSSSGNGMNSRSCLHGGVHHAS